MVINSLLYFDWAYFIGTCFGTKIGAYSTAMGQMGVDCLLEAARLLEFVEYQSELAARTGVTTVSAYTLPLHEFRPPTPTQVHHQERSSSAAATNLSMDVMMFSDNNNNNNEGNDNDNNNGLSEPKRQPFKRTQREKEIHSRQVREQRIQMKRNFQNLETELPKSDICPVRATNISTLQKAIRYVSDLNADDKHYEAEKGRLTQERTLLILKLTTLQAEVGGSQMMDTADADGPLDYTTTAAATMPIETKTAADDDDTNICDK